MDGWEKEEMEVVEAEGDEDRRCEEGGGAGEREDGGWYGGTDEVVKMSFRGNEEGQKLRKESERRIKRRSTEMKRR